MTISGVLSLSGLLNDHLTIMCTIRSQFGARERLATPLITRVIVVLSTSLIAWSRALPMKPRSAHAAVLDDAAVH